MTRRWPFSLEVGTRGVTVVQVNETQAEPGLSSRFTDMLLTSETIVTAGVP